MELLEPIIVLRRQTLYPTELRARGISTIVSCACRQLQDRLGFGFGSIGSNCDHFCWKLETQTRFFGDFLSEFHVMPDFIVQVRHAFASPPRPKIDNAGWRGRVVLQVGVAESTEGVSAGLCAPIQVFPIQLFEDRMQPTPQDVRLAEWLSCPGAEQQPGLPLANELPEHRRDRRV
jgi:hypothetical protein